MNDVGEVCELCGSDVSVENISIRVDSSLDDVVFETAFICLRCYTRYENNMAMFIDIYKKRLEKESEEEEEFNEMDI